MTWAFTLAGLFAVLNWYVVTMTNKKLEYAFKPLTLFTLTLAYFTQISWPPLWWEVLFGLALLFSLAGDVFLLLPSDQFIAGLVAFLLAQLAYVLVFNSDGFLFNTTTILMMFAITLILISVVGSITEALKQSKRGGLVFPVVVYGIVICLMFWSAAVTLYRPEWSLLSASLMTLGGASFVFSDSLLTWDRFVSPIPRARLWTMSSYHIAQFALTFGVLLHWSYL
jgi:uncharacterized membrane protein YhhN